ncbi:MAG: hypothetical protein HFE86_09160 [Clostridiales bacterium]|nr:hypothetical protein [Clostridiales bacterium]
MTLFKQMTEKRRNLYLLSVELILIAALTAGLFLGISAVRRDAYLAAIDWPESDFLPELPAAAPRLDCLSTQGMDQNQRILAASLQSVVNKTGARLFLSDGPLEENQALRALGLHFSAPSAELDGLLTAYQKEVRGLVVWDTAQPDTAHLAGVIAAAKRCLVVDGPQAEALTVAYGLPVLEDLRDRFDNRLEVYRAMLDAYDDKSARRLLIGADPAGPPDLWDYAAAAGAFRVWLDPVKPEEAALLEAFFERMPAGKSVYMGDWPDRTAGVELASRHGVASLSGAANLSVYAASRREGTRRDKDAGQETAYPVKRPENRLYIALVAGTGELEEGLLQLPALWAEFREIDLPMSWNLSPALPHAAPDLWAAYAETAGSADCFVNPTAGFGDVCPALWEDGESLLQFYKRMDGYAVETAYAAFTLRPGWDQPLSSQGAQGLLSVYGNSLPHLQALLDPDAQTAQRFDGAIRLPLVTAQSAGELEGLCRRALDGYDGRSPAFLALSAPLLRPEDYAAAAAVLTAEGQPVEFVTVADALALFRGRTEAPPTSQTESAARRPLSLSWDPYGLPNAAQSERGPSPLRYAGAAALSLLLIVIVLFQFHLLEKSRRRKEWDAGVPPPAA